MAHSMWQDLAVVLLLVKTPPPHCSLVIGWGWATADALFCENGKAL
ncbi:MAG: hypothetical protein JO183_01740 [Ktedonobacteraceae bacterium]|nr:hypothetical protein [Ktedonobacteraceae bacterium]